MSTDPDRYVVNNLDPTYNAEIVEKTRQMLMTAVVTSINEIAKNIDYSDSAAVPRPSVAQIGIAVAFLRVYAQADRIGLPVELKQGLPSLIKTIVDPCFTDKNPDLFTAASSDNDARRKVLHFGACGIMGSPIGGGSVGPALIELTRQLLIPDTHPDDDDRFELALKVMENGFSACFEATPEQDLQGDMVELAFGTAGYLYGIIGLRAMLDDLQTNDPGKLAKAQDPRLTKLVSDESMEQLVTEIIHTGVHGSGRFREKFEHAPPIMWRDFRRTYSLGGMHGVTGVLLTLLQVPLRITESTYLNGHMLPTLDWLIEQQKGGNIVRAYPPEGPHIGGPAWTCQFCHGAIGAGLMLSAYESLSLPLPTEGYVPRSIVQKREKRDERMIDCLNFIWKEGLVRKGLGVCHGVTGNAVPLLLKGAQDLKQGKMNSVSFGRALAMLRYATGMPPLNMEQSEQSLNLPSGEPAFRLPDRPYNLYEGLAGALCVWADALVLINNASQGVEDVTKGMVGFPLAGGLGVRLPL